MPIHLPPVSRRDFLARSVTIGAGAFLAPRLFAATRRPRDENSFALISDPHIAGDRGKVARGINMADQFEAVVKQVLERSQRPAGVLINGDLAFNTGESADYETFTTMVEPVRTAGIPLHLALGNHDHRERFWAALRREKNVSAPIEDRQVAMVSSPHANWFLLDSLDKTMSTPGCLGAAQLDWLARALDANGSKPALIMIHHNPDKGGNKGALQETAQLLEIIQPRRQVKAYFFGHSHRWSAEQDVSGIHFINLPTTAYLFDPAQPVGWVAASLEAPGMRLELRCLDRAHAEHGRALKLAWRS